MIVKHDRVLDVALGNSRKTKTWKNQSMAWSAMLDLLSKEHRTSETVAEYRAMGKEQQAEKKDNGGFVGGYCANGSRSKVTFRSILCLDADYADADLWDDWKLLYGHAAAVYSTHKHTPEKPRLRLVIPLERDVTPDEYQAIGRRVADTLGMNKFDDSTYDTARLMYWPSTSKDGEFVFGYLDAPLLKPDEVLESYHDWRDVSSWPMSSRETEGPKKTGGKQQDPLEKGGLIGAFCRAYFPIQDAIDTFIHTYQACDVPNRYTYTEGSTAGGVVIFEDKWSYSFHGTDPASGQQCNAWDLVRIHLFHELDGDVDPGATTNSLPSYKAMCELASKDDRVKVQICDDRRAEADADFDVVSDEVRWETQLEYTSKGGVEMTIWNVKTILNNDPKLAGKFALDELEQKISVRSKPPWPGGKCPRIWGETDDSGIRDYLEKNYKLSSKDKIFDALNLVAQEHAFHPIRDYLDSCEWDGVPRVETLFVDYLGAEDCPYTRAITRKTLAAAVARIYEPGCKFDHVLTLRGKQGIGKSTFIKKLGVKWSSDSVSTLQGKESYEQLLGVWLIELSELSALRKFEIETIKMYITKQTDRFRPAYGRRIQEFPRQCVFFATTNSSAILRDSSGNRRWWILDTPNKPTKNWGTEFTPDEVKQVWAEAKAIYEAGEPLYLNAEMEEAARQVQAMYEEENPKVGIVADYLDRLLPPDWETKDTYSRRAWLESNSEGTERRDKVSSIEIWAEALNGAPDKFDRNAVATVLEIMAKLPQWERVGNGLITAKPYGRQKYYKRVDSIE